MAELSIDRTVSPNEAKRAIRKCLKVKRAVFLWGAPGIGKSDIVKQIGDEQGRNVIDIRLSLWEPTDIKGIPYYNPQFNTMCWAAPSELPTDPDDNSILFLDELNSAAPATQAAAYQLILNGRVGTYVLPKNVSIVAAGNRDGDKGVTYRMPKPLANRFLHLELRVDFDDWMEWASKNRQHKDVVGYLNYAKHDLYDFDPRSSSRAFATPRSWSFVSQLLNDNDVSESTLVDLISGAVGEGLAVKFMAHRRIANQMPNPIEILGGLVKKTQIKEISAMYSLATSLCYELQTADQKNLSYNGKTWNEMCDNFFNFMMENFTTEIIVMSAKMALSNFELPLAADEMKSYDEFHSRYGKFIIEASEK